MAFSRRTVLASVATLAGCLGTGPVGTGSPMSDPALRLDGYVDRHSFLHFVHPDTMGVKAPRDRQFLFVGVNAVDVESPPEPGDLAFVADRRVRGWVEYDGEAPYAMQTGVGSDRPYGPEALVGWVGFDLPVPLAADTARIERTDIPGNPSWPVPDAVVTALQEPAPPFRVSGFDAPATTAPDEAVEVTFEVENVGPGSGTLRACLNNLGPMYGPSPIRLRVEAGGTVTHRHSITYHRELETAVDNLRFRLVTPHRSFRHEVAVNHNG